MKACTKCAESKDCGEFTNDTSKPDGLCAWCKGCRRVQAAEWRSINRDRIAKHKAEYQAANRDNGKRASAKWYAVNAAKAKATAAKWKAENPEKVKPQARLYAARWRVENPEKHKEAKRNWRAANPEAHRIHAHNRRARQSENGGKLSKGLATRLFNLQRGKCACGCAQPLGDKYHLDHIMPLALGGSNTDDNIQLLRAFCNGRKHARHPVEFMQQRGFLL